MIFVFKCVVWRRMRAYNLIELFKFITEDLEMYFQRKLLSLAFGKPQNLHLASRCFGRSGSSVSQSTITIDEKNPSKFHVPSTEDNNIIYTIGTCTSPQGTSGNTCPHQAAVALKFGISNIQFQCHPVCKPSPKRNWKQSSLLQRPRQGSWWTASNITFNACWLTRKY